MPPTSWTLKRIFARPRYFPVLGFMTGPPGFYRNGGLFRWLKIFLVRHEKPSLFLSQVLHFLDFGLRRRHLDAWLERTVQGWIRRTDPDADPLVFLDSGGFQFLHDANGCLRTYLADALDLDVERGDTYDLQMRLGARLLVSFDYPLDPRLGRDEAWERCRRSLAHAVDTLARAAAEPQDRRPVPMLAVHGLDGPMAARYTTELFRRIRERVPRPPPFGLALGSLVPLAVTASRDYVRILDIVASVARAVPEEHRRRPLHALGMSGPLVPLLVRLGVSSFDGSSFLVAANNLSYDAADRKKNLYHVTPADLEDCGCPYCQRMAGLGLERLRSMLQSRKSLPVPESLRPLDPASGRDTPRMDGKSSLYGLLAMHNYRRLMQGFRPLEKAGPDGDPAPLARAAEKGGPGVRKALAWLARRDKALDRALGRAAVSLPPAPPAPAPAPDRGAVSLALTSRSFNVLRRRSYRPAGDLALVLPCTPRKPYGASSTHVRVRRALEERFPGALGRIEKITLSGLYGPVPEAYENEPAVLRYDYRLRGYDIFRPQQRRVQERLAQFLRAHAPAFHRVFFLVAKSPYRAIVEAVHAEHENAVLLPEKPGRTDIASAAVLETLCRTLAPFLGPDA